MKASEQIFIYVWGTWKIKRSRLASSWISSLYLFHVVCYICMTAVCILWDFIISVCVQMGERGGEMGYTPEAWRRQEMQT
jgi:hypothetical protein